MAPRMLPGLSVRASVDERRFSSIFHAHFAFVWRTLRRLGVPQAYLPDASQRVFWCIAQRLEEVAVEDERGFLFGTSRRVAADFRRLDRRMAPTDQVESLVDRSLDSPEELLDQKRARELLDRLLDALPDELREVLILRRGCDAHGRSFDACSGASISCNSAREHCDEHAPRQRDDEATGGTALPIDGCR